MTRREDLISVLLPVHNAAAFLPACLESLLNQSHKNIEIIAIDDFSKDDSYKVLKSYNRVSKRLRIYRNVKHYGLTVTLNRAMKCARGKYIAFMDPRGVCKKNKFKTQLAYLRENPETVAVGTQCIYLDERNKKQGVSAFPVEHLAIHKALLNGFSMQFETALINAYRLPKDLLKISTDTSTLVYTTLFVKMLKYGSFANLDKPLYYQRKVLSHVQLLKRHFVGYVKVLLSSRMRPSLPSLFSPLMRGVS